MSLCGSRFVFENLESFQCRMNLILSVIYLSEEKRNVHILPFPKSNIVTMTVYLISGSCPDFFVCKTLLKFSSNRDKPIECTIIDNRGVDQWGFNSDHTFETYTLSCQFIRYTSLKLMQSNITVLQ